MMRKVSLRGRKGGQRQVREDSSDSDTPIASNSESRRHPAINSRSPSHNLAKYSAASASGPSASSPKQVSRPLRNVESISDSSRMNRRSSSLAPRGSHHTSRSPSEVASPERVISDSEDRVPEASGRARTQRKPTHKQSESIKSIENVASPMKRTPNPKDGSTLSSSESSDTDTDSEPPTRKRNQVQSSESRSNSFTKNIRNASKSRREPPKKPVVANDSDSSNDNHDQNSTSSKWQMAADRAMSPENRAFKNRPQLKIAVKRESVESNKSNANHPRSNHPSMSPRPRTNDSPRKLTPVRVKSGSSRNDGRNNDESTSSNDEGSRKYLKTNAIESPSKTSWTSHLKPGSSRRKNSEENEEETNEQTLSKLEGRRLVKREVRSDENELKAKSKNTEPSMSGSIAALSKVPTARDISRISPDSSDDDRRSPRKSPFINAIRNDSALVGEEVTASARTPGGKSPLVQNSKMLSPVSKLEKSRRTPRNDDYASPVSSLKSPVDESRQSRSPRFSSLSDSSNSRKSRVSTNIDTKTTNYTSTSPIKTASPNVKKFNWATAAKKLEQVNQLATNEAEKSTPDILESTGTAEAPSKKRVLPPRKVSLSQPPLKPLPKEPSDEVSVKSPTRSPIHNAVKTTTDQTSSSDMWAKLDTEADLLENTLSIDGKFLEVFDDLEREAHLLQQSTDQKRKSRMHALQIEAIKKPNPITDLWENLEVEAQELTTGFGAGSPNEYNDEERLQRMEERINRKLKRLQDKNTEINGRIKEIDASIGRFDNGSEVPAPVSEKPSILTAIFGKLGTADGSSPKVLESPRKNSEASSIKGTSVASPTQSPLARSGAILPSVMNRPESGESLTESPKLNIFGNLFSSKDQLKEPVSPPVVGKPIQSSSSRLKEESKPISSSDIIGKADSGEKTSAKETSVATPSPAVESNGEKATMLGWLFGKKNDTAGNPKQVIDDFKDEVDSPTLKPEELKSEPPLSETSNEGRIHTPSAVERSAERRRKWSELKNQNPSDSTSSRTNSGLSLEERRSHWAANRKKSDAGLNDTRRSPSRRRDGKENT